MSIIITEKELYKYSVREEIYNINKKISIVSKIKLFKKTFKIETREDGLWQDTVVDEKDWLQVAEFYSDFPSTSLLVNQFIEKQGDFLIHDYEARNFAKEVEGLCDGKELWLRGLDVEQTKRYPDTTYTYDELRFGCSAKYSFMGIKFVEDKEGLYSYSSENPIVLKEKGGAIFNRESLLADIDIYRFAERYEYPFKNLKENNYSYETKKPSKYPGLFYNHRFFKNPRAINGVVIYAEGLYPEGFDPYCQQDDDMMYTKFNAVDEYYTLIPYNTLFVYMEQLFYNGKVYLWKDICSKVNLSKKEASDKHYMLCNPSIIYKSDDIKNMKKFLDGIGFENIKELTSWYLGDSLYFN